MLPAHQSLIPQPPFKSAGRRPFHQKRNNGQKGERAHVTLVDARLTHLWKPLLHEVVAGTIRGERGETMAIEPMVQWWLDVNGVNRERANTESLPDLDPKDGCRISRTTWPVERADAAPMVFYRAEGGGHALPSIAYPLHSGPILRRIIGPVCHDAEGAELAWNFFKSFAGLPDTRR